MGRISEALKVKVVDFSKSTCPEPYYIQWLNSLGGWNFWLFEANNTLTKSTSKMVEQAVYREDYSVGESFVEKIRIESGSSTRVVAPFLSRGEAELLSTIAESVQVNLLTNPWNWAETFPKWQRVIVEQASNPFGDRKQTTYEVQLQIRNQEKNLPWA